MNNLKVGMMIREGFWAVAFAAGLGVNVAAQISLVDNDFSGSTPGTYNGTTGQSLGAAAPLGNASGLRFNIQVQSTGGVGNSASLFQNQDVTMRARNTFDFADASYGAVSFSVYFRFQPTSTILGGFLGMGWALGTATDNVSPFTSGGPERVLVGLRRVNNNVGGDSTVNTVRVSSGGRLGELSSPGNDIPATQFQDSIASVNLVENTWYQVSFDLAFDYDSGVPANSQWTLASFQLRDWGNDGLTGGSTLISQISDYTWNPGFGNSLDTTHNAYAFIAGNGDRGIQRFDNALVVVPEPWGAGALSFGLVGFVVLRRQISRLMPGFRTGEQG